MIIVRSVLSFTGTPNNGSLPIGNGQGFTINTLTPGTNITITNGPGTITIDAAGGGGSPAGSTNEIQFNNAGTFAADSDLRWIISDNRLVLGTENTADTNSRMVVIGKGISTNNTFVVHNSTGTNNALVVRDDGLSAFGTTPITGRRLTVQDTLSIKHISVNNGSISFTDGVSTYGTILVNGSNGRINIASGGAGGFNTGGVFLRTNNVAPICFTGNNSNPFSGTVFLQMFGNTGNVHLQNGGTYTDIPSSILSLNSTEKGFLPPRMTTAQRDLIATPATGLLIYNTTTNKFSGYDGTNWQDFH